MCVSVSIRFIDKFENKKLTQKFQIKNSFTHIKKNKPYDFNYICVKSAKKKCMAVI